ncbi:hypothetical protein TSUD_42800 [Trifolium subterraneum]|uniref:Uncharacterized protein n=1 Tax=Trifolium subterraneum TaxID=3900 RepID=A0A2Z6LHG3_TRISU|nr:hypothetical protein TSUD_42800 [Trifolium subterraneum]
MANQPKNENQEAPSSAPLIQQTGEDQVVSGPSAVGFINSIEHRWRKLRKTEDSVRTLQERLRKLVEAEKSGDSAKVVEKGTTFSEKLSK